MRGHTSCQGRVRVLSLQWNVAMGHDNNGWRMSEAGDIVHVRWLRLETMD